MTRAVRMSSMKVLVSMGNDSDLVPPPLDPSSARVFRVQLPGTAKGHNRLLHPVYLSQSTCKKDNLLVHPGVRAAELLRLKCSSIKLRPWVLVGWFALLYTSKKRTELGGPAKARREYGSSPRVFLVMGIFRGQWSCWVVSSWALDQRKTSNASTHLLLAKALIS